MMSCSAAVLTDQERLIQKATGSVFSRKLSPGTIFHNGDAAVCTRSKRVLVRKRSQQCLRAGSEEIRQGW